jgi:hypothetical protein
VPSSMCVIADRWAIHSGEVLAWLGEFVSLSLPPNEYYSKKL